MIAEIVEKLLQVIEKLTTLNKLYPRRVIMILFEGPTPGHTVHASIRSCLSMQKRFSMSDLVVQIVQPRVFLGYGTEDRFYMVHKILGSTKDIAREFPSAISHACQVVHEYFASGSTVRDSMTGLDPFVLPRKVMNS